MKAERLVKDLTKRKKGKKPPLVKSFTNGEKGKATDLAAKKVGLKSGVTLRKIMKIEEKGGEMSPPADPSTV